MAAETPRSSTIIPVKPTETSTFMHVVLSFTAGAQTWCKNTGVMTGTATEEGALDAL